MATLGPPAAALSDDQMHRLVAYGIVRPDLPRAIHVGIGLVVLAPLQVARRARAPAPA